MESSNIKPYSRSNCLYSTQERDVATHRYVFNVSENKQGTVKIPGSLSKHLGYPSMTPGPFLNACLKKGQIFCYKCFDWKVLQSLCSQMFRNLLSNKIKVIHGECYHCITLSLKYYHIPFAIWLALSSSLNVFLPGIPIPWAYIPPNSKSSISLPYKIYLIYMSI